MLRQWDGLTVELVPHCASVTPDGWVGDHKVRPLRDDGRRQAAAIADALCQEVAAIYSSPALRCLQTVAPLERATSLAAIQLPELLDTENFANPRTWTEGAYSDIGQAIGGSWAAGRDCGR